MTNVVNLVTRLDFEALADAQLPGRRFDAVLHQLENDDEALGRVARTEFLNELLRQARTRIYGDRILRDEVKRLMKKRAA